MRNEYINNDAILLGLVYCMTRSILSLSEVGSELEEVDISCGLIAAFGISIEHFLDIATVRGEFVSLLFNESSQLAK
jgi:hypothetical protein